jgi:hypothetical protein
VGHFLYYWIIKIAVDAYSCNYAEVKALPPKKKQQQIIYIYKKKHTLKLNKNKRYQNYYSKILQ